MNISKMKLKTNINGGTTERKENNFAFSENLYNK